MHTHMLLDQCLITTSEQLGTGCWWGGIFAALDQRVDSHRNVHSETNFSVVNDLTKVTKNVISATMQVVAASVVYY